MSYPKPLSEKTLARMYREANIDEKKSDFLHKLFLAAANLYGVVDMRNLWDILKEIAEQYDMTEIRRKDLLAFSSIARREVVPYYVYEVDELYSDEERADLDREIVHKSIVKAGYSKKAWYYSLAEEQEGKPYYIPDDLLAYATPSATQEETALLNFLKELKVTAKEAEDRYGRKFVCEHTGKNLGSFSFMNNDENLQYKWFNGEYSKHTSKNEKALQELIKHTECNEAEKIFLTYKERCNFGGQHSSYAVQIVFDELNEVGVKLSEKQFNNLVELLAQFNNNSHLWCNRGWMPSEMIKCISNGPIAMSLGPGIKCAIAKGGDKSGRN